MTISMICNQLVETGTYICKRKLIKLNFVFVSLQKGQHNSNYLVLHFVMESGEKSLAESAMHSFLFRCLKLLLMQPINRVTTLPRMIIFANL